MKARQLFVCEYVAWHYSIWLATDSIQTCPDSPPKYVIKVFFFAFLGILDIEATRNALCLPSSGETYHLPFLKFKNRVKAGVRLIIIIYPSLRLRIE